MRRLRPCRAEEYEVDIAPRNMIPRMQLGLERSEFCSFDQLEAATQRQERYLRISRDYEAPPLPEQSLLPDRAYPKTAKKNPVASSGPSGPG